MGNAIFMSWKSNSPRGICFYLLKQLFPKENARKNSLKRDSLWKMQVLSNNIAKNSVERQESVITKTIFE